MDVTIYTKENCIFCTKAKAALESYGPKILKLDEDFNKSGFYSQFGDGCTFPQVVVNDMQHLGGCTETVKYLKENELV